MLEENVLALQASIPEMQGTLESRISEMMQQMEVNQFKLSDEYSRKVESYVQGQEDIKSTMSILMAEVKNIRAKVGSLNEENITQQSSHTRDNDNGENSKFSSLGFDQRRRRDGQTENVRENSNWRLRRLEFPIFSGEDPEGWIVKAERSFDFY